LVTNNAVAGKDSSFIVTNLSTLISSTDDIVICNIGTNNRTYPHTKIDYYADLQKIYDYCTNLGIDIIFVANIPAQVNAENYSAINLHMEDINHLIMKFTTNNNIEYVDLYSNFIDYVETRGLDLESLYSDTLHPNDSGYDIIFYCICKGLGIARRIPNATWTN
jgi:lysophospholipase L1-like esterase